MTPPLANQTNRQNRRPVSMMFEHRAAQRTAQQADVLRDGVFPAIMTTAVNLSQFTDPHAFQVYLDRLKADVGNPQSPIADMLIEQLALAHLRIAQLHASTAHTKDLEATKIYTASAARLLGEFRRSALAARSNDRAVNWRKDQGEAQTRRARLLRTSRAHSRRRIRMLGVKRRDTEQVSMAPSGSPKRAPNPRRVAAGRRNRALRGPLTVTGIRKLQLAALRHKPWQRSTGPRTAAGKTRAALNGKLRQKGVKSVRELRAELAGLRSMIDDMAGLRRLAGGSTIAAIWHGH